MNAHFLPFAARKIDQLGRRGGARELLEQRTDLAAERASGNVRMSGSVFDYRIVGAADFERALAGANVQSGLTMQFALQNQLADQFQFRLRSVSAHSSSPVM